jgi:NADPH:quinone reductase-like Zn-dependent oxidoreductase
MDAAGVVDKLGEPTDSRLAVGDPVIAYVIPFAPHGGTYAEKIVVAEASVVPAPRDGSFPEASTLLLNATTAQLSLNALGLAPETTLAVVGGAGAVGGYAIQLAKANGLRVLTDATPLDEELVRSLGADVVVERSSDAAKQIRHELPDGAPGLIDGAALDALALPAVADNGGLVTLKGWNGPSERGIAIHPVSSFASATDTALFDRLRRQAEDGIPTLRVAEILPASRAADAPPPARRRWDPRAPRPRLLAAAVKASKATDSAHRTNDEGVWASAQGRIDATV